MGQNGSEDDVDIRRKQTPSLPRYKPIVQRSAQKQRRWKIVNTLLCRFGNDYNCFSHNYFCKSAQFYGAVAEMCEEYESLHERTGRPVVRGQSSPSFVPSVIKTNVPLNSDDPAHKDLLLQQYGERIEKLSQQDKMSKFCMDAGFLNVVEIGQCFMTKDTAEFSQFMQWPVVSTLFQETKKHHNQKDGSKGSTKIGPVLEVALCYLHGKYGVEMRISSVNRDNSHSWVRISHGSNKFVMNLTNNEQEIPEVQLEEHALKLNAKDFARRSKAKSKSTKTRICQLFPRNNSYWEKNLD